MERITNKRNTSSIHKSVSYAPFLPPEILTIIFWMVTEDTRYMSFWNTSPREGSVRDDLEDAANTMRAISQVCKFWRDVALSCKRIWGLLLDIDMDSDKWTEELVSRSDPAPLVVQSTYYEDDPHGRFLSAKWTKVLEHVHRFQIFVVAFNGDDYIAPILGALQKPAPLLEVLHIEQDTLPIEGDEEAYYVLREPLLAGNAPNLEDIRLHRTIINRSLDLSAFELVHMELSIHDNIPFRIPTCQLLDMLAEQPLLEFLNLFSHALPVESDNQPRPREIRLPYLQKLDLHCHISDCNDLFGNLVLPPTCSVHLQIHQTSPFTPLDGLIRGMNRLLREYKFNNEEHAYWRIETKSVDDFKIHVGLDPAQTRRVAFDQRFTLCFQYDIRSDLTTFPPSRYFFAILNCLRIMPMMEHGNTFLSLDLRGLDYRIIQVPLLIFFLSFKAVRKLLLTGDTNVRNITEPLLKRTLDSKRPVLFPDVQNLILQSTLPRIDVAHPEEFFDYTRWRSRMGKPIPHVELQYLDDGIQSLARLDNVHEDCWTGDLWR